jgi:putative transposase
MVGEAQKLKTPHGLRFKNPLYSIDSTIIDLCFSLFPWADFRTHKAGIKLTVKLDLQGNIPCFITDSNARQHDVKKIRDVPLERGDVVAFDRGYTDYEYFSSLCDKGIYFVTRLKTNARYTRVRKNTVVEGKNIVSDYEIRIPALGKTPRLRKIIARDPETKKRIVLLTNNMKWSAATVAGVYKRRWQIELFFKAIKQNLKIKRFYGNSKNAVMTQIWIALIVYLLFYILKMKTKSTVLSFTHFMSVLPTILFQRRSLHDWLQDPSPPGKPPPRPKQFEFVW